MIDDHSQSWDLIIWASSGPTGGNLLPQGQAQNVQVDHFTNMELLEIPFEQAIRLFA